MYRKVVVNVKQDVSVIDSYLQDVEIEHLPFAQQVKAYSMGELRRRCTAQRMAGNYCAGCAYFR